MSGATAADPFMLPNDWILSVPIEALTTAGVVVGLPAGDVETVAVTADPAGATPGLAGAIGLMADGTTPAVILNALVDGSATAATVYTVVLSDSAGETPSTLFFKIVPDNTPTTLLASLPGATHTSQAVPPAG